METMMIKKTGASSFHEYGSTAMQYAILTPEVEAELVERFQEQGCMKARQQIIHSHMRFVMTIARQMAGSREDREDLVQEGMLGLMVALDKFDRTAGYRVAVYATHWIKSHIREYMLDTARIFRIATTKPQRKLFYNLHRFQKEGRVFNQRELEHIAEFLAVPVEDVREMEKKLIGNDLSIDVDPEHNAELLNSLFTEFDDPAFLIEQADWEEKTTGTIERAISSLDDRSRSIINDRWFVKDAKTLHELGAIHNVSYERIRQLENKSMNAIKTSLRQLAA